MAERNTIRLFLWELESMPEYSCSLPSGQTFWKMWRRNMYASRRGPHREPRWVVGQYTPHPDPKTVGIRWFKVHLREGPKPRFYTAPDWVNMARWRRDHDNHRMPRHGGGSDIDMAGQDRPRGPVPDIS